MRPVGLSDGDEEEENLEIADNDDQFMRLLGHEIDKVTAFYVAKARSSSLLFDLTGAWD